MFHDLTVNSYKSITTEMAELKRPSGWSGLMLNKAVEIKEYGQDRYRRTLRVVILNGSNVNLEMVKAGYAEVYRGIPTAGFDSAPYWKAEEEARAATRVLRS